MPATAELIQQLDSLTPSELNDLVKQIETKWGVSGTVQIGPTPIQDSTPVVEVQKTFTVMLQSFGANKVSVIKEIRTITKLGLAESKALVEDAPKSVKEDIELEEAEAIKKQLEAVGATVELK